MAFYTTVEIGRAEPTHRKAFDEDGVKLLDGPIVELASYPNVLRQLYQVIG